MVGCIAICLVFDRLDIAHDIEELIERISHEAVAERHLNDAGKSSASSKVSLEESEFVWTSSLSNIDAEIGEES